MTRVALDEIGELVDRTAPDPVLVAHQRLLENEVRRALTELGPEARLLLCLGFGLSGAHSYGTEEIARILQRNTHFVR
jgi:hypothetical protein